MKPEFAFYDLLKARDGLVGMMKAVQRCIREELESDGFSSAFLHGLAGYALLFLILAIEFSFALVCFVEWVWANAEQFVPSAISQRQRQPTNEFSQLA